MRKLGLSIYPEHSAEADIITYLERGAAYGFSKLFTCLLSVADRQSALAKYKRIFEKARTLGYEIIVDVNPAVFKALGASYEDLGVFHALGVHGLRIDEGFGGKEESDMTYNPYGLKIELNMSWGTRVLEQILCHQPNRAQLVGCHNFYPHEGTGLGEAFFKTCCEQFKTHGLRTAAFVNAPSATLGPWPLSEGLCTLEDHRFLPIDVQAKALFQTQLIDEVIVANCFASDAEFKALGDIERNRPELRVQLEKELPEGLRAVALFDGHFRRGDLSDRVVRATASRTLAAQYALPLFNACEITVGDVLVDSDAYGRYAGELHIALKNRPNNGKISVIGKVVSEDLPLAATIRPWQKFVLKSIDDSE